MNGRQDDHPEDFTHLILRYGMPPPIHQFRERIDFVCALPREFLLRYNYITTDMIDDEYIMTNKGFKDGNNIMNDLREYYGFK